MPQDSLNINSKGKQQNTFDAIVIGSGISGGWAATLSKNTPKERYEKLLLINYCMFNLRRQKSHQILMKFNLTIKNLKKEHSSNQTM
ncbi:MAG: hypothetical protein ACTHML_14870 [Ginsengibacter sp.]